MKTAILLHGTSSKEEYYDESYRSASNSHWFPWLSKQLIIKDIPTVAVEVPNSYAPDYKLWVKEFERFDITPETILVGHSNGGGFLVRWLSEHPEVKVDKVVLVAPWLDPDNEKQNDFFDFEIDTDFPSRTNGTTIFNSDNDMDSIQKSVEKLRQEVPSIVYKELHDFGHFTYGAMGTEEFPELLKLILS